MSTAERAAGIADAMEYCNYADDTTKEDLLKLVAAELGHPEMLDAPQTHGDLKCLAVAPQCIFHIIAGNTPMAGIQSIIRGLLLGSHNLVKLPSIELPEIIAFVEALPQDLKNLIELESKLPDEWLRRCNALIVFGNDDTIRAFRQRTRADQIFIAHGHRISFGIIFKDDDKSAAKLAARDISLFDQQGCLSPHNLYIRPDSKTATKDFAGELAAELELFNQHCPRRKLSTEENAQITSLRDSYNFRQSNDPSVKLWTSDKSTDWTVIYEEDPQFAVSPLNRVVFVKPLPKLEQLSKQLFLVHSHLSSIAIHPFNQEHLGELMSLGASRICPLGKAQDPSLFWHQDGSPQLSPWYTGSISAKQLPIQTLLPMPERPSPTAHGTIKEIREPRRLFEVEMPNGFRSLAVLPHNKPAAPAEPLNQQVEVIFSPYDMSQCKITRWL